MTKEIRELNFEASLVEVDMAIASSMETLSILRELKENIESRIELTEEDPNMTLYVEINKLIESKEGPHTILIELDTLLEGTDYEDFLHSQGDIISRSNLIQTVDNFSGGDAFNALQALAPITDFSAPYFEYIEHTDTYHDLSKDKVIRVINDLMTWLEDDFAS